MPEFFSGRFSQLKRIFELDLRSLAVCRIGLGLCALLDCLFRVSNYEAHYSNFGIMPLNVLYDFYRPQGACVHCISESQAWGLAMFALHALFAIGLMLGWKTRLSTFFTWLFTVSIHYRNPLIIDGGDVLLRCFLVWIFFLPTAEYFSLDARGKKPIHNTTTWWINLILPLQMFAIYFMSALLKTGADWWPLGTATGYALSLEAFVTPIGRWLTEFPEALKTLSRSVYLIELWCPFLLLMWGRTRLVGAFIFMGFHAGLGLAMDLALFPWIAFACLASLLPREFWEFLELRATRKKAITHLHAYTLPKAQKILSAFILPAFAVAAAWNIATLMQKRLPVYANKFGLWLHVDQYWGMFAPYPLKDSGWYEFGVQTWGGEYAYTFVDNKMEDEWDENKSRPINGYKYFVDQRWRKYLINLWDRGNSRYRPALAAYLCRKWNREYPAPSDKAQYIDMEFILYQNTEYLQPARGPANINLGQYRCE